MDLTELTARIYYAIGKASSLKSNHHLTKAQKQFQKEQFDNAVLKTLEAAAEELEAYLETIDEMGSPVDKIRARLK